MTRIISWFSCGASSAVATRLAIKEFGGVIPTYCETGAEHKDNERFLIDCEKWFGVSVTRISSTEFADTWDVWEQKRYLAGIEGAPCTTELKIAPRLSFQRPHDIHFFGYTSDKLDIRRFENLRKNYPELNLRAPLIEQKLNKRACLSIIASADITVPIMYSLGFHNNNCIPCVKATSPNYWSLVRKEFPTEFKRMADLSRQLGARLTRIEDVRLFIDQIPTDWPTINPISPSCDFQCHLVDSSINDKLSET